MKSGRSDKTVAKNPVTGKVQGQPVSSITGTAQGWTFNPLTGRYRRVRRLRK